MTVANQTNRTSAVGSNTVGQVIPFSFPITETSDLVVKTRVTATGVEADFTETTDYTLTINGKVGGSITLVAALATTSECHIKRDTPNLQSVDLEQGGAFTAENVENGLDKNTKLTIENLDAIDRSVRARATDDSSLDMELPNTMDSANQYLAFTVTGEPTVVASVAPATATVTAFAETLLDDANAAAMRTTLRVVIGTDVQAWDAQLDDLAALAVTDGNIIEADGTNWGVQNKDSWFASMGDNILTKSGEVLVKDGNVLTKVAV